MLYGGASMPPDGIGIPDDPLFAALAIGEAVHLSRADVIGTLLRKHGSALANEPLPTDVKGIEKGDTALHLACRLGRVDAVRTLLRAGVFVHQRNASGKLALELASASGMQQQIEQCFYAELLQNVCTGQAARIERLLSGGIDATKTDGSRDEATLLHWAAAFGQGKEIVSLLVQAGVDPNARNKAGSTPAHEASANGAMETLEALKEAGADLSLKDSRGKTPKEVARSAEVAASFDNVTAALKESEQNRKATSAPPLPSSGSSSNIQRPSSPPPSTPMKKITSMSTIEASASMPTNNATVTRNTSTSSITALASNEGEKNLKRKVEEQEALIDSLRSTIDGLLRDRGVQEYVQRLQDHVGALTRQLAATAEQRDKLQNLYVANDRELERLARELALSKAVSPITHSKGPSSRSNGTTANGSSANLSVTEELEELRLKCAQLTEELERERKEGYAAARMHLTYEADLRAEIKALQEQMLANEVGHVVAMNHDGSEDSGGFFSSFLPW